MSVIVFLILCFALVCHASSLWFLNNNLHKSKNILPVPIGMSPGVGKSIKKGAEMALEYCQQVFKWDKWNCPTLSFLRLTKQQPTKETAFSKAIVAAGVVYTITKDCSSGAIPDCGCDSDPPPSVVRNFNKSIFNESLVPHNISGDVRKYPHTWTWGGCSDDPKYALNVAKKLFDGLETVNNAAGYAGRHNYNVGREVIRDSMVRKCRCHGVSGSCSMQTCWMQVSSFVEVAKRLREKYKKAERLTFETIERNSARELFEKETMPVKRYNLLYLVQSSDYCLKNSTEGLPGTRGRICSRDFSKPTSIEEKRSCRTLCKECGYKVKMITKKVTKECNCKFVWCCEVKCDTCVVDVDEYFCD